MVEPQYLERLAALTDMFGAARPHGQAAAAVEAALIFPAPARERAFCSQGAAPPTDAIGAMCGRTA